MGWCSGTDIFDVVVGALLDKKTTKEGVISSLIVALEGHDWDCQGDSEYFEHPVVRKAMKALHPEWYKDE
jgi:hypothetical protein